MAKVTREHREAWHLAEYGYVPTDGDPYRQWCTSGVKPHTTDFVFKRMQRGALAVAEAEERGAARERAAVVAVLSAEVSRLESFRKTPFGEGSHAGIKRMLGVVERLEHLKPCADSQDQDAPTSPKG